MSVEEKSNRSCNHRLMCLTGSVNNSR